MNYIKNYYTLKAIFIKKMLLNIIMSIASLEATSRILENTNPYVIARREEEKKQRNNQEKKAQETIERYYSNIFYNEKKQEINLKKKPEQNLNIINKFKNLSIEKQNLMKGLNGLYRLYNEFNMQLKGNTNYTKTNILKQKTSFCNTSKLILDKIDEYKFNGYFSSFDNKMKGTQKFICEGIFTKSGKDCIILSNRSIDKINKLSDDELDIRIRAVDGSILILHNLRNVISNRYPKSQARSPVNANSHGGKKNNKLNNKVKIEKLKLKNKKEVEKMKNNQKKEIISLKNKQKKELNKLKNM